jgi:aminoglycoside phosphotransferase (APT) family kinase protein
MQKTTPRPIIDSVVRSVYGRVPERLVRITSGGLHETYRVEVRGARPVVVRIARRADPWFVDEEHLMARAREVGVPTPDVIGVEHLEHGGELLSLSVLGLVPGRSLQQLADELPAADLDRLVVESGELLARLHTIRTDRGMSHELHPPDEASVARALRVARQTLGPAAAAAIVERGVERLRELPEPTPGDGLAHGDWLPKHLFVEDGKLVGVIDWEFAGPAPPAYDLARWEVSAGEHFHHRAELLRRGYARISPRGADDAAVSAFAIDWALEVLGWENPASTSRRRRCVEVIARHVDAPVW